MSEQLSATVLSDIHGRVERVKPVVYAEYDRTGLFVFNGDTVDGTEVKQLIDFIISLGDKAVSLLGNHEWVLRNALRFDERDPQIEHEHKAWIHDVWSPRSGRRYEVGMLESYGVTRTNNAETNARALLAAMEEAGHKQWLDSLRPYAEFDDFVAVHAGPNLQDDWETQAGNISIFDDPKMRLSQQPDQLFNDKLAEPHAIPQHVSRKKFITGHVHLDLPAEERRQDRHITLASSLRKGHPLFVWRSATDEIVAYAPDGSVVK